MTLNVLILEPPLLSSVGFWRFFMPFQVIKTLQRAWPVQFNFKFKIKDLTYEDAWSADIVIVPRPGGSSEKVKDFLDYAKRNGARVIVDLDDDILNLPECHQLYHSYKKREKDAISIMEKADLFWFSTEKFLETYTKQGIVVKNAIPAEWLPSEPAPDRGIWTWMGSAVQWHDITLAGWDWYEEIKDKPKQWMFFGSKPPLRHGENAESFPYVDNVQEYIKKFRESGFNGVWKPLLDHRFNEHKSNISWIAATMSGGVCLTNFAGRPGWEYSTKDFPTYKTACELWEKSKEEIVKNYNLITEAQKRAESIVTLCSHLLPISLNTGGGSQKPATPTKHGMKQKKRSTGPTARGT